MFREVFFFWPLLAVLFFDICIQPRFIMTFDSLVLSKIHLQDVPKLSSFVDRSLKAMLPAGSDDERLHRLKIWLLRLDARPHC